MKPGDVQIKNTNVLNGFMEHKFDPWLIKIVTSVAEKYGVVITESWRKRMHSDDLHALGRAVDLRTWCYQEGIGEEIRDWINSNYEYDPERPDMDVAIIHSNRDNLGVHFHIQVHPNTIKRQGYGQK